MRRRLSLAVGSIGLILAVAPAQAHHWFAAEFDANKSVTLHGVVTRVEWTSPHTWIHMDVKGSDGEPVKWMIESATPAYLFRVGLTKDALPVGTDIVVEGFRSKDGANRAGGKELTLPDGRKLLLGVPRDLGAQSQ